jgi:hypothetical protein
VAAVTCFKALTWHSPEEYDETHYSLVAYLNMLSVSRLYSVILNYCRGFLASNFHAGKDEIK